MSRLERDSVPARPRLPFRRARGVPWLAGLAILALGSPGFVSEATAAEGRKAGEPAAIGRADSSRIAFAPTLAGALELAKADGNGRPVLVILYAEDEPGCEDMEPVYRDDEFVALTRTAIVVAACPDDHTGGKPCPRFPGSSCAEHVANFDQVFRRYFVGERTITIPQHLVLAPGGELLGRLEYVRSRNEIAVLLKRGAEYVANPAKAIEKHGKQVIERLKVAGTKTGEPAIAASHAILADLETAYAASTIELVVNKGSRKAKLTLIPQLDAFRQHADSLFVALLADRDAKVREATATAVREFPVVCSNARKRLELAAIADKK